MGFTTVYFFLFLLIGIPVYYLVPKKVQWLWLLFMSIFYYCSFSIKASLAVVFTTAVIWIGGLLQERIDKNAENRLNLAASSDTPMSKDEKKIFKKKIKSRKKAVLITTLFLNFGLLAVIKYTTFVLTNTFAILQRFGVNCSVPKIAWFFPVGISFFTFQAVTYSIDVYRGKYGCEKNPFKLGLFVGFFPQIMQGPIGRFDGLGSQLFKPHYFSLKNVQFGLQRMFWGIFKKLVMADRAGVFVTAVFDYDSVYTGGAINIVALLMYSIQLYMDFSGGMDIVIGVAEAMGITMDENFRQPYFSKSIGEFWRRWHITLGAWMKDYIFYSFALSGFSNKLGKWAKKHFGSHIGKTLPICIANLLIFFIVGIWHGAEWRFIIYGLYNGFIIAFSNLMAPVYKKCLDTLHINPASRLWQGFQIVRTFILVNIGWVFDCSIAGMGFALSMFKSFFTNFNISELSFSYLKTLHTPNWMYLRISDYVVLALGCVLMLIIGIMKERGVQIREAIAAKPIVIRWAIYYAVFIAILLVGYQTFTQSGFMYANF